MATDLIAAIPTQYKGVQFRSRLEARWAVFFDGLNIEWQYEPQKLTLVNGVRYIPDFFLPKLGGYPGDYHNNCVRGQWIEVKPEPSWFSDEKTKGIVRTIQAETYGRFAPGSKGYFIADSHFKVYQAWYNYSRYKENQVSFNEMFIMRTKKNLWSISTNCRMNGKLVDISDAIRAAQNYHFDQPGQHT